VFILIAMLLPFLGLLAVEGVTRLCGLGGYPPTVHAVGTVDGRSLIVTDTTGAASYFSASVTKPGSLNQFAFFSPKPENTIRIVLAGGSAIKGFPQPMGFAPSAFMQAMLSEIWPDRDVEVINLGTTAVASFPVLDMLTEMLEYEPDLVVVYAGHNEFFGASGVASLHRAGRSPGAIRFSRWCGSLGISQLISRIRGWASGPKPKAVLMEAVIGESHIPPDSPLRAAAADNLYAHVCEMITRCQARSVPVMVCTLASNEQGLAPIGRCDASHLAVPEQEKLSRLLKTASDTLSNNPTVAVRLLNEAAALDATHARVQFRLGQAYEACGDRVKAREHFQHALDLDTMPWRAPSRSMDAIRRAAKDKQAVLCDVQQAFRDASPGGSIGWTLFDDHVHPSMRGQWLLAKTFVEMLVSFEGPLHVSREALEELPLFEITALRLGRNPYDTYTVVEQMCRLFDIGFMRESNPEAQARYAAEREKQLAAMPPGIRTLAEEWCDPTTHKRFRIPLSGMVARAVLRHEQFAQAEALFRTARRNVPTYCGTAFEYTYFMLACREQMHGALSERDRALARQTIDDIALFQRCSDQSSGQPERFKGRLYQLLGEFAKAIPPLREARKKLSGSDALAVDMALIRSYVVTGDAGSARAIATAGVRRGGPQANIYRQVLNSLPPQ
jgi:tetratricopeptide (TPR) repeat protein